MGLVSCALRHDDEVDAAVGFLLTLFLRSFASTSRDARSVYTLLDNVFLGEIGAGLCELCGLGLTTVSEADNDELSIRIILQAEGDVVTYALASIVKARSAGFVVAAIAGFCCLRRRRWLLDVNIGGSVGSAAAAITHR